MLYGSRQILDLTAALSALCFPVQKQNVSRLSIADVSCLVLSSLVLSRLFFFFFFPSKKTYHATVSRAALGSAWLRLAPLGWAGLGWAGLGWAGLGWAGPDCTGEDGVVLSFDLRDSRARSGMAVLKRPGGKFISGMAIDPSDPNYLYICGGSQYLDLYDARKTDSPAAR